MDKLEPQSLTSLQWKLLLTNPRQLPPPIMTPTDTDRPRRENKWSTAGSNVPKALFSDGEGWRLQREDFGLDEELTHPTVYDFPVLRSGIQYDNGSLIVVLPILKLSSGVLQLQTSLMSAVCGDILQTTGFKPDLLNNEHLQGSLWSLKR